VSKRQELKEPEPLGVLESRPPLRVFLQVLPNSLQDEFPAQPSRHIKGSNWKVTFPFVNMGRAILPVGAYPSGVEIRNTRSMSWETLAWRRLLTRVGS
jgi:hypothetical protein